MTNRQRAIKDSKESLHFLCTKVLKYKDVNERTHRDIVGLLESPQKNKLICVPRGCLKSSIACVAYPIWMLIRQPNLRILIDSELYTNSVTFIREIKGHMKSPLFINMFGDLEGSIWRDGEIQISTRTKTLKEASITAGGIGTTKVGQHFDLIIHDDMNSPNNTNTPENARKVIEHFQYNTSILEPDGTTVVIGTRYAANDLIGWIMDTQECEDFAA